MSLRKKAQLNLDYDMEIKWRYTYGDGISIVAFSKEDADIKRDKIIKDVILRKDVK